MKKEFEIKAREFYKKAGIVVRDDEPIEVADFGLDKLDKIGLQLCVYINTERVYSVVIDWSSAVYSTIIKQTLKNRALLKKF